MRSACALPLTILIALLLLGALPTRAAELAVGLKAGTLGAGAELDAGLSPHLSFRLAANGYSRSERREASGIEYDATADLRTAEALLDLHPGGGGFRLTGGLAYNGNKAHGSSLTPASGFYPIGDLQVPAALLGHLDGKIEFDSLAPYAGLGWGNRFGAGNRLGFSFDLGVLYQGKADVTLTPVFASTSPIPSIPIAQAVLNAELRKEEADIEDDLADYQYYPVLSLGLTYRF